MSEAPKLMFGKEGAVAMVKRLLPGADEIRWPYIIVHNNKVIGVGHSAASAWIDAAERLGSDKAR